MSGASPASDIEARYRRLAESCHWAFFGTASKEGAPEGAVMLLAPAGGEDFYFYTFSDSRKYPNLIANPRVALVLFEAGEYAQLDGTVTELDGAAAASARATMIEREGGAVDYHDDPRCRYFRFTPRRYALRTKSSFPSETVVWER